MSTPFSDGVAASLAPWFDSAGSFEAYTRALGSMFDEVLSIVGSVGSPDDPANYTAGWSTLLDPTTCPDAYLPYCAAFIGVQIPSGTSASDARALILAEQNFNVGQGYGGSYTSSNGADGGAIVLAAQLWLTGSQHVTLLERTAADGSTADAYHFVLIVLTSEVIDAAQLTAAVNAVKPVGVQWTLTQTSSWTITELEGAYSTIADVEAAFPTISNLETDVT